MDEVKTDPAVVAIDPNQWQWASDDTVDPRQWQWDLPELEEQLQTREATVNVRPSPALLAESYGVHPRVIRRT